MAQTTTDKREAGGAMYCDRSYCRHSDNVHHRTERHCLIWNCECFYLLKPR